MPSTATFVPMKAWILEKHGPPDRAFVLRERPDPVAGAGQVLIRSEGFGLNYADVMASKGLYREAPAPPSIIGYECVGRVVALGAGAPPDLLGKRVTAITRFGGYAELVATDHRAVAVIDEGVGIGEACALATQGCTAWYMTHVARPLRAGERVVVHSAAGGVGHLLVSIAVKRGCEVFAIASGADKLRFLKGLGAQHTIDRQVQDPFAVIRELTGGKRIDATFNAVGGRSFKQDMALLDAGGTVVIYGGAERGSAGGPFGTMSFVWRMGLLVPIFLMMNSRGVIGVNMLRIGDAKPALLASVMQECVAAAKAGRLRPHVHAVFAADRLAEAHAALASGSTMGKVALRW